MPHRYVLLLYGAYTLNCYVIKIDLDACYDMCPTALQEDSSTCGFWIVMITLSLTLHLDMQVLYQQRSTDIKNLLSVLYASHVTDGLTAAVLFRTLQAYGFHVSLPRDATLIVSNMQL